MQVVAIYERALWRERGYSGEVVGDGSEASQGPVFNAFDTRCGQGDARRGEQTGRWNRRG
jgi:hypothetical protein